MVRSPPAATQCDELHINKASPRWQVTPKPAKKFIAKPSRGRRSRDLQQSCECAVSGRLQSGPALVWSAASLPGLGVLWFVISDLTQPRPGQGSRSMKILTGNSNRPLSEAISAKLALPLVKANIRRFSDNEIFVEILENVRGEDMFVIQSTSYPANDHLMELLITIDALRRSSARRITAVMPYYGYARQDRRTGPRTPISAKLVANLLTHAGANRVLTLDLHAAQIQGFFDIPV